MWRKDLEKKYSKSTLAKFNAFMKGKSYDTMVNNATDEVDDFIPTKTVMTFESSNQVDNSERCFPQR